MKSFKEYGTSYNLENSKGESVSDFSGIDINKLGDGVFHCCKTVLVCKVLEDTRVNNFGGFQHPPRLSHILEQI